MKLNFLLIVLLVIIQEIYSMIPTTEIVIRVIAGNLSPDVIIDNMNNSILHIATQYNQKQNVLYLLDKQANPNVSNCLAKRPIHIAASYGYVDIVQLLLTYKADPDPSDICGETPLGIATKVDGAVNLDMNQRKKLVALLLQHGADKNKKSTFDKAKSPLEAAIKNNLYDLIVLMAPKYNPQFSFGMLDRISIDQSE